MQATAAAIFADQGLSNVERTIAPLSEVFRLQNVDELDAAEQRYLNAAASDDFHQKTA